MSFPTKSERVVWRFLRADVCGAAGVVRQMNGSFLNRICEFRLKSGHMSLGLGDVGRCRFIKEEIFPHLATVLPRNSTAVWANTLNSLPSAPE